MLFFAALFACVPPSQAIDPPPTPDPPPVEASPPSPKPVVLDLERFTIGIGARSGATLRDAKTGRSFGVNAAFDPDARVNADILGSGANAFSEVVAFPIGDGRIGLQAVTYELPDGGSMDLAAGRYVYFLLEPESGQPIPAHKEEIIRSRGAGCVSATGVLAVVADVDGDGINELGLIRERVTCAEGIVRFTQDPVAWMAAGAHSWTPSQAAALPPDATELPIIMAVTPTDYSWSRFKGEPLPAVAFTPNHRQ